MSSYVYIESEPGLCTVGFYDPKGKFQPESDHSSRREAAERVHYLNGGRISNRPVEPLCQKMKSLAGSVQGMRNRK